MMGQAISGIGNLISGSGNYLNGTSTAVPNQYFGAPLLFGSQVFPDQQQQLQQLQRNQYQYIAPTKKEEPIPSKVKELATRIAKLAWLEDRIDRITAKGREWIESIATNSPEPVKVRVVASSVEHEGIPTRRLSNGDHVWIAPTDWQVPDHVLKRYQQAQDHTYEEKWEWAGGR